MTDTTIKGLIDPVKKSESSTLTEVMTAQSFFLLDVQGVFTAALNVQPANRSSEVAASIAEADSNGKPLLGDAVLTIHNVVPEDGDTVRIRAESSSPTPLNVMVYVFVRTFA